MSGGKPGPQACGELTDKKGLWMRSGGGRLQRALQMRGQGPDREALVAVRREYRRKCSREPVLVRAPCCTRSGFLLVVPDCHPRCQVGALRREPAPTQEDGQPHSPLPRRSGCGCGCPRRCKRRCDSVVEIHVDFTPLATRDGTYARRAGRTAGSENGAGAATHRGGSIGATRLKAAQIGRKRNRCPIGDSVAVEIPHLCHNSGSRQAISRDG